MSMHVHSPDPFSSGQQATQMWNDFVASTKPSQAAENRASQITNQMSNQQFLGGTLGSSMGQQQLGSGVYGAISADQMKQAQAMANITSGLLQGQQAAQMANASFWPSMIGDTVGAGLTALPFLAGL